MPAHGQKLKPCKNEAQVFFEHRRRIPKFASHNMLFEEQNSIVCLSLHTAPTTCTNTCAPWSGVVTYTDPENSIFQEVERHGPHRGPRIPACVRKPVRSNAFTIPKFSRLIQRASWRSKGPLVAIQKHHHLNRLKALASAKRGPPRKHKNREFFGRISNERA